MPSTVYLVTGGTRSGKSSYAQRLCESLDSSNPIYVATSNWNIDDVDFQQRIQRHQADRGEHWTTIEEPLQPSLHLETFKGGKVVLVDCLTLWLTNYFMAEGAFTTTTTTTTTSTTAAATAEFSSKEDNGEENVPTTKNVDTTTDGGNSSSSSSTHSPNELSERALSKIKQEFDTLIEPWDVTFVFVTNELGSGTHASTEMSRKFVDAHGWFNQHVAAAASRVVHMVCGIPNVIKQQQQHQTVNSNTIPNQDKVDQANMLDQFLSARKITMDPNGYFLLKLDRSKGVIVASFHSCIVNEKGECCDFEGNKIPCDDGAATNKNRPKPLQVWECRTAKELTTEIFERWPYAATACTSVGHAAYIGREAQKAEDCLYHNTGKHYQQD